MKITLIIATYVSMFCCTANAAIDLGSDPTYASTTNGYLTAGAFSETFTFTLSGLSNVSSQGVGFSFTNGTYTGSIQLKDQTNSNIGSPVSFGIGNIANYANLNAGSYSFLVSGNGNGGYQFGVNVAAVPEPETYAMMLAGLGLVGAIARRHKEKLETQTVVTA